MDHKILLSPLQGFTDVRFRNAFCKYFKGIDAFYSPYIRLNGARVIKPNFARDIKPENNIGHTVIPQIMTNEAEEFLFVTEYVQSLGYKELNWNLGCPYPMAAKRCLGSGLLQEPERIRQILEKVHAESDTVVSMKMRMGYENSNEILEILPLLEAFPIKNLAIHARIGKQLYKGGVDLKSFERCLDKTSHKIYYNGDITSVSRFNEMKDRFPTIDTWMIGRGVITDPFLPEMMASNNSEYPADRLERFSKFHDTLYQNFDAVLSGPGHILTKMLHFWEYFAVAFPEHKKLIKKVKKSKSIGAYDKRVEALFQDWRT